MKHPLSLVIIAVLFFLTGVDSAREMVWSFAGERYDFRPSRTMVWSYPDGSTNVVHPARNLAWSFADDSTDPIVPPLIRTIEWRSVDHSAGYLSARSDALYTATPKINLSIGVIGLFIGPGLLTLKRGWRICALAYVWLCVAALLLITGLCVIPVGFVVSPPSPRTALGAYLLLLEYGLAWAFLAWVLTVLNRPDVRELFGVPGPWSPREW